MLIQDALDGGQEALKDAQEVVDAILSKGIPVVPLVLAVENGCE
jgi:hypothetical protein